MLTIEARIETGRASRYLTQLCKHATSMNGAHGHRARSHLHGAPERSAVQVEADWTDTSATLTFTPGGRCNLSADATTLTVHIDASDEDSLQRIQDIITNDLERFGQRDHLSVRWAR